MQLQTTSRETTEKKGLGYVKNLPVAFFFFFFFLAAAVASAEAGAGDDDAV